MSHGNSYSHGLNTSFLGYSNAVYENTLSNHSQWDMMVSGYGSASPPNTESSGSSTISQNHETNREDLSVDYLISSLLQVVNGDSFTSNDSPSALPEFRHHSNSFGSIIQRCRGCADTNCDSCTSSRSSNFQNSNNVMDHFVLQNSSLELPSPPLIQLGSPPPAPNNTLFCEIHRDAQRFYCQTCSRTLCGECGKNHHRGHVTVHLMEAVDGAGVQANQVMSEARLGIASLRDDLDAVHMAAEALEHKARQATTDAVMCIRRVAVALEVREKELVSRIEKARAMKYAALKARDDGLRNGLSRLTKAVEKLSEAMESSSLIGNPLDILVTKDMASAEVFQVRQNRQNLPPCEENWISFSGPEGNVLHGIANLGSIMVNSPGPIGDRRAVRGRGTSPQSMLRQHQQQQQQQQQQIQQQQQQSQLISLALGSRGRPVPSNNFPVTVRVRQNSLSKITTFSIIGNDGEPRDNLCRPWGIACDKEGNIIVADRSNNRIQIYREDGSFVRRFGTHGTGPGQFDRPAGVAVDGRRRIVVADKDNHRIQVLTMEGLFLLTFGEKGSRCGQFNYPWDVAVNTECQIVVSDTRNHRIQLFSPEGVFLRKYGYETTPSMWKHFDSPRGVAFNPEGKVVTTDFNNHRVIVIDSDFMNAKVLSCDSSAGTKQFMRPQGLVIDDEGNIIIADSRNHRIQVLDSSGNLKWKFGSYGKGTDEMDRPSGIALSPSGRIAVVDFGNNRVLMI